MQGDGSQSRMQREVDHTFKFFSQNHVLFYLCLYYIRAVVDHVHFLAYCHGLIGLFIALLAQLLLAFLAGPALDLLGRAGGVGAFSLAVTSLLAWASLDMRRGVTLLRRRRWW